MKVNNSKSGSNKILLTVFFTIFLDLFGVGILIPIFPLLIMPNSPFKITPDTWNMAHGFIMAGWLMAAYPLAQFVFTPLLGQLADKYGRKPILLISILGTIISYILFALAIEYRLIWLLFMARILDGVSGANIAAAQAIISDVSPPQSRAKNFGLVGVAVGIGFVLGPFIGGRLSDSHLVSWFNPTTPFWFAAGLSLINLLLVLGLLPETLINKTTNKINLARPIHNLVRVFKHQHLTVPIFANFLFNAGFSAFTTFWGVILAYHFGCTQAVIGDFFAYVGVMIILAQGLVVRRLSGKVKDYKVLDISIILVGVCILAYYLVPSNHVILIYYITPFLAVFVALTRSFNMSLLAGLATNNTRGEVLGVNSSFSALAQAIPAILAGYIATIHVTGVVLFGAIVTIIGGIYFRLYFNRNVNGN
jgi:DHA1 family tetracycline resistance protein-like MFS transporter